AGPELRPWPSPLPAVDAQLPQRPSALPLWQPQPELARFQLLPAPGLALPRRLALWRLALRRLSFPQRPELALLLAPSAARPSRALPQQSGPLPARPLRWHSCFVCDRKLLLLGAVAIRPSKG